MNSSEIVETRKLFNRWNIKAQGIELKDYQPTCFQREIWWAHLGKNIGWEQNGGADTFLRPVIVVRCFNNALCWIVPTTKTIRDDDRYFFDVCFNDYQGQAILTQLQRIDSKRLHSYIGKLSAEEHKKMLLSIRRLLDVSA